MAKKEGSNITRIGGKHSDEPEALTRPLTEPKIDEDTGCFTIEKDVEQWPSRYPLKAMEIGDSFLAPIVDKNAVRNAITQFKKKYPERRFVTKAMPGGVRSWRVDDKD